MMSHPRWVGQLHVEEGVMVIWLVLALIAAVFEAVAVQRQDRKLELFAKPAVMVFLLIWLYAATGLQGNVFWFGLGILFSLLGDVLLLSPTDRMFMLGLLAFLLTHIFYIIGFRNELLNFTPWSFILIFFIYVNGLRLLRRILGAMRMKGFHYLLAPVIVYGLVISLMLYAALSTIFDPAWTTGAAFLVSVGAFLFYISDLILAWNKFVSPMRNGRIFNIVAYHLGQIGLIAGVISQFQ
jgi:uncharacterized membrane protein YhhN